jgi:hypothetical protein
MATWPGFIRVLDPAGDGHNVMDPNLHWAVVH